MTKLSNVLNPDPKPVSLVADVVCMGIALFLTGCLVCAGGIVGGWKAGDAASKKGE